jgi:hypothetical protein
VTWNAKGIGRLGRFTIERRAFASDDPLPDPSWRSQITAVVEVRGRSRDEDELEVLWEWLVEIADATDGAVFSADAEELAYIGETAAKVRAKHLVATGAIATLATWIRATTLDNLDDEGVRRGEIIGAIWGAVRSPLERAARRLATGNASPPDAKQLAAVAVAFHDQWDAYEPNEKLDDFVLAVAGLVPANRSMRRAAAEIAERRQTEADNTAAPPTTIAEWQALVEGVGAKHASARRRFERFVWEDQSVLTRLALAAIEEGYEPPPAALASVLSLIPLEAFPAAQRTRLKKAPMNVQALRDAVLAYRDAAGQRAASISLERYEMYEKYRTDPLVAKPRHRDIDVAMFRPLNDALYGAERNRPQLPLRVAALLCDRRLDEARAAYVDTFGEANADAAIRDGAAYFAPEPD